MPGATAEWTLAAAADFNLDGGLDIIIHRGSTGATQLWLMDRTTRLSAIDLPRRASPWTVGATGDFDGDGDADIFWRNTSTGRTRSGS